MVVQDRPNRLGVTPLVNFSVSIGKTQAAGTIVVTGGKFGELGAARTGGIGVAIKNPIINGVGMLIGKHPAAAGTGVAQLT